MGLNLRSIREADVYTEAFKASVSALGVTVPTMGPAIKLSNVKALLQGRYPTDGQSVCPPEGTHHNQVSATLRTAGTES